MRDMPNSPNTQNPSGTSLNFSLLGLQSHRICLCFANTLILDVTLSQNTVHLPESWKGPMRVGQSLFRSMAHYNSFRYGRHRRFVL